MKKNDFLERISHSQLLHGMTQKEIKERCRRILYSVPRNGKVLDTVDFHFLMQVFALSPYYELKTQGKKIVGIERRDAGFYGSTCFYLIREDGSYTDISFTKIFRVDGDTDDVLKALRSAVVPSIEAFRMTFRPFTYEGIICNSLADVDIDHYDLKFRELASIWIEQNGGVDSLVKKINPTADNNTHTYFLDEELKSSFRQFHDAHTHLRFLPKVINRSNQ